MTLASPVRGWRVLVDSICTTGFLQINQSKNFWISRDVHEIMIKRLFFPFIRQHHQYVDTARVLCHAKDMNENERAKREKNIQTNTQNCINIAWDEEEIFIACLLTMHSSLSYFFLCWSSWNVGSKIYLLRDILNCNIRSSNNNEQHMRQNKKRPQRQEMKTRKNFNIFFLMFAALFLTILVSTQFTISLCSSTATSQWETVRICGRFSCSSIELHIGILAFTFDH